MNITEGARLKNDVHFDRIIHSYHLQIQQLQWPERRIEDTHSTIRWNTTTIEVHVSESRNSEAFLLLHNLAAMHLIFWLVHLDYTVLLTWGCKLSIERISFRYTVTCTGAVYAGFRCCAWNCYHSPDLLTEIFVRMLLLLREYSNLIKINTTTEAAPWGGHAFEGFAPTLAWNQSRTRLTHGLSDCSLKTSGSLWANCSAHPWRSRITWFWLHKIFHLIWSMFLLHMVWRNN